MLYFGQNTTNSCVFVFGGCSYRKQISIRSYIYNESWCLTRPNANGPSQRTCARDRWAVAEPFIKSTEWIVLGVEQVPNMHLLHLTGASLLLYRVLYGNPKFSPEHTTSPYILGTICRPLTARSRPDRVLRSSIVHDRLFTTCYPTLYQPAFWFPCEKSHIINCIRKAWLYNWEISAVSKLQSFNTYFDSYDSFCRSKEHLKITISSDPLIVCQCFELYRSFRRTHPSIAEEVPTWREPAINILLSQILPLVSLIFIVKCKYASHLQIQIWNEK